MAKVVAIRLDPEMLIPGSRWHVWAVQNRSELMRGQAGEVLIGTYRSKEMARSEAERQYPDLVRQKHPRVLYILREEGTRLSSSLYV